MAEEMRETSHLPEQEGEADLNRVMARLRALNWSGGLTRDAVRALVPDFPAAIYLLLPSERHFQSSEDLATFFRHALRRSHQAGIPAEGASDDGGPAAWGHSPSLGARAVTNEPHGVGSGTDSGFTGSDDVGTNRSGATYGPESREEEAD